MTQLRLIPTQHDFHRFAELAAIHNCRFEDVAKRAENGAKTTAELIGKVPESHDWITYQTAAKILCVEASTVTSAFQRARTHKRTAYFGVRVKSRSTKGSQLGPNGRGSRGIGILFCRSDIEKIRDYRSAGISALAAFKVFEHLNGRVRP